MTNRRDAHVAGSMGNELGRLGDNATTEIERLARERADDR